MSFWHYRLLSFWCKGDLKWSDKVWDSYRVLRYSFAKEEADDDDDDEEEDEQEEGAERNRMNMVPSVFFNTLSTAPEQPPHVILTLNL